MSDESLEELRDKLNGETGRLTWPELERHFARGVLVRVAPELDLVEVAATMARDDRAQFEAWLHSGQVTRVQLEDAADYHARNARFWAVVVAPWVVVQEITSEN